jgi:hypothetical protein
MLRHHLERYAGRAYARARAGEEQFASLAPCRTSRLVTTGGTGLDARELRGPDWIPGSVIYTGPNEPNLRVVHELDTTSDDPEMHFTVLVVEPA